MSLEQWFKSINPKVKGSWNLHNALKDVPLDFFLLTSSISGSLGTATEGNYCAGNAFQDAFARYRRSMGQPAVAIGLGMISEVGYLAEHPEIESLLLRRGLHPITETEFLLIIDNALSQANTTEHEYGRKHFVEGHILTGLESHGLLSQRSQGFEGDSHVLDDARSLLTARSLRAAVEQGGHAAIGGGSSDKNTPDSIVAILQRKELNSTTRGICLLEQVQKIVAAKLCNLLLLHADQLQPQTKLSLFGLDSMLAAELRSYLYRVFNVDLSFLMSLDKKASVESFAEIIAYALLQKHENEEI
ncbi:MAG: hypothetical protein LQ340_003824 [Diploschistes diacapsis]|nr:MAG: hypothetical protein LQ340_003824 [Diploschistes diacapsis]